MLTAEQQNIIENSIWVVNTALKRQGLTYNEDLRQSAIVYMCECLMRFDPSKNIKWTTYAYKNVYLFIKRTHKKECLKDNMEIGDDVVNIDTTADPVEYDENILLVQNIFDLCTPYEKKILQLKMEGYKHGEISVILHCSISKINNYMQSIKEKTKGMGYER